MKILTFFNIIYLLCNALSIYTKYKAMYIFFNESKANKKIEISLFLGYFVINSGLNIIFNNPTINLANNIIIYLLLTFNYISSISKKVISTAIIYAISFFIEAILYHYFFQFFITESSNIELLGIIVSRIIFYFIISLFTNLKYIKANYKVSLNHFLIILLISICTIYIAIVLTINSVAVGNVNVIFSIASLLIINIVIFYIYDILNKIHEKELEKKLLEQQNNFYIKQLKIMSETQDNIRLIKHDVKNHLMTIKAISSDREKINDYINNLLELDNMSGIYANSGNSVFDSILNYKLQEAKRKGIETELDLKIPYQLNIRPYDIGVILGNLLDNAITAASQSENDKNIKIIIYFEKSNLSITIINTFNGIINKDGEKYKTTNDDKSNHGLGLISVEKVLEKYDGEINLSNTDCSFTVKVLIYIN